MPFNMQEYQKNYQAKYRAKKKEEREQMKTEQTTEKPENLKSQSEDPSLSLEQKTENRLTPEQTKTVEEKIKPAPTKKNKKSGKIALNPQAFGNFSIGIEKTTLLIHKDKTLKEHEEQLRHHISVLKAYVEQNAKKDEIQTLKKFQEALIALEAAIPKDPLCAETVANFRKVLEDFNQAYEAFYSDEAYIFESDEAYIFEKDQFSTYFWSLLINVEQSFYFEYYTI